MGLEREQRAIRESLAERLKRQEGRLALKEVLPIAMEIAATLSQAHAEGRWHGALHLGNLIEQSYCFCAPEQLSGDAVADPLCDVFAFGAILYKLLTGVPPYEASSVEGYIELLRTQSAPLLRQRAPELPSELEELVGWMLAKRGNERPPMAQVHDRLRELHKQFVEPPRPPPAASPAALSSAPTRLLPAVGTRPAAEGAARHDGEIAAFAAIGTALALIAVAYLWHTYLDVPAVSRDLQDLQAGILSVPPDLAAPVSDLAVPAIPVLQDLALVPKPIEIDLQGPEDLRSLPEPPDLLHRPDMKVPTAPHRWVCKPIAPTQECVNQDLAAELRQKIVDSLANVDIKLCPNEQLVWFRFSARMELDRRHGGAVWRVSDLQERQFSQALVGRLDGAKLPGEITIHCAPNRPGQSNE